MSDLLRYSGPFLSDIKFKAIKVTYDLSIIDAIKLSVENEGFKVITEVTNIQSNLPNTLSIDISSKTNRIEDEFFIILSQYNIGIFYLFKLEESYIKNNRDRILGTLNELNKKSKVKYFLEELDSCTSYIQVCYQFYRVDEFDKSYKYKELLCESFAAINTDKANSFDELLNRIDVYVEDELDMNLSGKWNATESFEYLLILDNLNNFISVLGSQYESLLSIL